MVGFCSLVTINTELQYYSTNKKYLILGVGIAITLTTQHWPLFVSAVPNTIPTARVVTSMCRNETRSLASLQDLFPILAGLAAN